MFILLNENAFIHLFLGFWMDLIEKYHDEEAILKKKTIVLCYFLAL